VTGGISSKIEAFQYAPGFSMSVLGLAVSADSRLVAGGAIQVGPNRPARKPDGTYERTPRGPAPPAPLDLIRIWRATDGTKVRSFTEPTDRIFALSWSPREGGYLASASNDRILRLWDMSGAADAPIYSVKLGDIPVAVSYSPDGTRIAASNGYEVSVISLPQH